MDKGWCTAMEFTNFKKAFDTADHEILLTKLKSHGIIGSENVWLASNLRNSM